MLTLEQEISLTSGQTCELHRHSVVDSLTADVTNGLASLEKEVAISAAYTAPYDVDLILCSAGVSGFPVTLPIGRAGKKYTVIKTQGAGTVTLQCSASQTINGVATYAISSAYVAVRLKFTKTAGWVTL